MLMTAINYEPITKHSLSQVCLSVPIDMAVGIRALDDYMVNLKEANESYSHNNKLVIVDSMTNRQFYFELIYGMGFDNIPRVRDVLFTDNVRKDIAEILKPNKDD